jgi:hypothetical protein
VALFTVVKRQKERIEPLAEKGTMKPMTNAASVGRTNSGKYFSMSFPC